MSIQHVRDKKIREKLINKKQSFAISSIFYIVKLAILITYIQYEVLQINYQVLCRSRGVIYNKDGKFIYKPAKASQGHIIVIEDRHPESSSRNVLPQQTTSSLLPQAAYQPVQLIGSRAYQGGGIESASSVAPVKAAGIYNSNGQIQLINLNDLQGLIGPSHSSQVNLARAGSESPNHYPPESRLPPHQPIQIIPLIQLYHPARYQTANSFSERPYGLINIAASPSMANLGIHQDLDRLHNDAHNPILDNGAPIITSGQYSPAQSYQQHGQQQQSSAQYGQSQVSISQAQGGPQQILQVNNAHSTRPRSDADSMSGVYDNSPSPYDNQHERGQALAESAFIDDPLTAFRNVLPHSDDNPIRPHASDGQVRSKISGFLDLSSEHVDDISDGGPYGGSLSHQPSSRFNHLMDISNPKVMSHDGARGVFGRSALPSLINISNLSSGQSGNSSSNNGNSNSSRGHIVELEDRHKKNTLNLDTLGKSKLLKNSKRILRNKTKQLISETRKNDNHFKQAPAPIDDDLNSKDLRGNQYWNQFKDQFEIM